MLRFCSLFTCLLLSSAAIAQNDTAVLLDGTRVSQKVKAITPDGKVEFEGDAKPVDLQGLRRIERTVPAAPGNPGDVTARVHLVGGGAIRAKTVVLDDTNCTLTWAHGELKLPIAAVRGIRFSMEPDPKKLPVGHDTFDADLIAPPSDKDRLFAVVENKIQSLPGIFVELTADKIKFQYENQDRELERSKAFGLTLAGGGRKHDLAGKSLVHLADGSSLWAAVDSLTGDAVTLKLLGGIDSKLPWASVQRIEVRSDRLAFLSDLEPTDIFERSIAYVGPWQRDRSVRGKPLTIKGKVFDKGLGVHATTRLTYTVDPRFTTFAASIGIDDQTKGKGDCEFAVLADGKELFRKRIKAGEEPVEVRVKLDGAKKITLAVEAGEDLDFADHGDWGDARLIRE